MSLISIITVNRNNAAGLRRTIQSVIGQKGVDFEFIVIDGASTDGSVRVIEEYESDLSFWASEPDTGIYQAMNKGIRKAEGDYCLFLNSGDWLCGEGSLAAAAGNIDGKADIYYSDLRVSDGRRSWLIEYPRTVDVNYFVSNTISHQNALIRRKALAAAGLYREDFSIASDWYFFLYSLFKNAAVFRHIPECIAYYYYEGMSNDPKNDLRKENEHRRGIEDVFGELGPSVNELRDYRSSVYGYTIRQFGYSRPLHLLLKTYRALARRIPLLRSSDRSRGGIAE